MKVDENKESNYQLIIRIPITARDDPDARQKAKCILDNANIMNAKIVSKLQRLENRKPPTGVQL